MAKDKKAELEKQRDALKARAYDALVHRNQADQVLAESEQEIQRINQELSRRQS